MKWLASALIVVFCACGGNSPPNLCPTPPPPTTGDIEIVWRSPDQVDLTWTDMPATVKGGSEANVFTRRIVLELGEARRIKALNTFMGFDRKDVIEAESVLYDDRGVEIYTRSLHLEAGVDENYDAWEPREYTGPVTVRIFFDAVCRVNGKNAAGCLTARCHLLARITFEPSFDPPPPPSCSIPGPEDPKWKLLGEPRTTRQMLNAAKAVVGNRTGEDPLETLALLAAAVRNAGGCAVGPWDDEVAIKRADGNVDGWHAVAFGTGGYTGTPKGDAWTTDNPPTSGCGDPVPQKITKVKVTKTGNLPKPTFDSKYNVGPNREYCAAVGYTDGRSFCAVRPDGHPERGACEALFKPPIWSYVGTSRCFARPNPFIYRCERDAMGTLTVCDGDTGTVCVSIEVKPVPVVESSSVCLSGIPWCLDGVNRSTPERPCKHNPSADPTHCEMAPYV